MKKYNKKDGYAIYCTQRGTYFPADEKSKFNSLKEIKEQLLSYHSIDGIVKVLTLCTLYAIHNINLLKLIDEP